jgi:hypothetical protein
VDHFLFQIFSLLTMLTKRGCHLLNNIFSNLQVCSSFLASMDLSLHHCILHANQPSTLTQVSDNSSQEFLPCFKSLHLSTKAHQTITKSSLQPQNCFDTNYHQNLQSTQIFFYVLSLPKLF